MEIGTSDRVSLKAVQRRRLNRAASRAVLVYNQNGNIRISLSIRGLDSFLSMSSTSDTALCAA